MDRLKTISGPLLLLLLLHSPAIPPAWSLEKEGHSAVSIKAKKIVEAAHASWGQIFL